MHPTPLKRFTRLNRLNRRFTLTIKMLIATLAIGVAVWLAVDHVHNNNVKELFQKQLSEKLETDAENDRIVFDQYIRSYQDVVKQFTLQKNLLVDYMEKRHAMGWPDRPEGVVIYRRTPTPWFPGRSALRNIVNIEYILLIDTTGKVKELYTDSSAPPPKDLLEPAEILQKLSHNQSFMTLLGSYPFVLSAGPVRNDKGIELGTILVASRLDDEFFLSSHKDFHGNNVVALLEGEQPKVLVSNRPDLVPSGTTLEELKKKYLVAGKSFFDYGSSDLLVRLVSLKPKSEVDALTGAIISRNRRQIAITALVFILSFTAVMYAMSRYVRLFTTDMIDFSNDVLGIRLEGSQKGDEFVIVRDTFLTLAREIVETRDTVRRLTAEALNESEERFRKIFEDSPVGMAVKSLDLHFVKVNATLCRILGYTEDELKGKKITDVTHPDDIEKESIYTMKLEKGEIDHFNTEKRYIKKNGAIVWIKLTSSAMRGESGEILYYLAVLEDIMERKIAEEQIKSLARFPGENPYPVLRVDPEGYIIYSNGASNSLLDAWSVKQGMPLPGLLRAPVKDSVLAGSLRITELTAGELTYQFVVTPVLDSGYVNLYGQDITALKNTGAMLKVRQAEVEKINAGLEERVREEVMKNRQKDLIMFQQSRLAAMGEMIGHIAHQWRQPLTALSVILFSLKDSYNHDELHKEEFDLFVTQAGSLINKMSTTIDDFRNFFKPSRQKETFLLNKVLKDTLSLVSATFKNSNVNVRFHDDGDVTIYGFPSEYSQVILNLIGNARDAIIGQGISGGLITIDYSDSDSYAVARIKDNGGGIPESIIGEIFDPYFTTKEQGKGTGLGLYMSKVIIEEHMKGRIEVENMDGGAEFRVITPKQPKLQATGTADTANASNTADNAETTDISDTAGTAQNTKAG
ncbi:MAG: PAS domain S-box protein [Nitrospirae bacterium]|nr:PAS domain S-box protein [Nitrospirota bacterium]